MSESHLSTKLHLFKQNFKFSSAHFLIFDEKQAEKLHGHNYQVRVEIEVPAESEMETKGYYIDFSEFKKVIKGFCDEWDEHVLLPARHADMKIKKESNGLHVNFRDRFYVFPENEVILLPITNTSVEQLSRLLGEKIHQQLQHWGLKKISVMVEETQGQAAETTASLSR